MEMDGQTTVVGKKIFDHIVRPELHEPVVDGFFDYGLLPDSRVGVLCAIRRQCLHTLLSHRTAIESMSTTGDRLSTNTVPKAWTS
jgi:hypothetical protein